jgi:2-oxoglutarate ferredoxin oxidoreductase subunit beta
MKVFKNQIEGKGFSFVEVLSPCPTDWWMSPQESVNWIRGTMMKVFPLGVFKDVS